MEMWYSPEAFNKKKSHDLARKKKWGRDPANHATRRNWHLQKAFGISHEQYLALLSAQNGVCAICKQPETNKLFKLLAVDHCHETNQIRGLLCNRCNKSIGLFEENIDLLQSAIQYLTAV